MSIEQDERDDQRENAHGIGTLLSRETCESCGGRFDAEARETEGHPGERLLEILTRECAACLGLGAEPPRCLGGSEAAACGGSLQGRSPPCGEPHFECDRCDAHFSIDVLRSLLFGRACEEIVTRAVAGLIDGDPTWLLIRKARALKVLP